jgi:hypothetical protein
MNHLPATLAPERVVVTVETLEQTPLDLAPFSTTLRTLDARDYDLANCPYTCRIERKNLMDLVGCVGGDRARFKRELLRLLAFPVRVLEIESISERIESHEPAMPQWKGKVTKESVIGSLLGWQAAGLSIHMAGDHERAGRHVARLLYTIAKRRYRELRSLVELKPN